VNIHEYQAKEILDRYGVPTPTAEVASTAAEAKEIATRIGGRVVVKAQVHAGGRGKVGGVKLVDTPEQAEQVAGSLLGTRLVTKQTGAAGVPVEKVMIAETLDIKDELYLSIVIDGDIGAPVVMASTEGGMEIEVVAEESPDKILTTLIDPNVGLREYQIRDLGFRLGFDPDQVKKFVPFVRGLFDLYLTKDCSQVEINPLVLTDEGDLLALDGNLNFDDNALYRPPEIAALRDPDEEDERERAANEIDLAYVGLDGNIGCMVNGAGLAMATLDMIHYCGGSPANFLDAGGGADKEKVKQAFKLILGDENVEAILVNIFGGIVRCDLIAEGVVAAAAELGIGVPLVVRLQGTKAVEGREILAKSDLNITSAETLKEAGELVVAAVKGAR